MTRRMDGLTIVSDATSRTWAILIARAILGLIFFMAGVWKVFQLGPLQHARRFFVDPYAHTFLPRWSLWATGTTVPVVELARVHWFSSVGTHGRRCSLWGASWCSSHSDTWCSSRCMSFTPT